MPISRPFARRWLALQATHPGIMPQRLAGAAPDSGATLVAAVAAIVAVAAERARAAGELPALLEALDGVLAPANDSADPREAAAADLPAIADADPVVEAARLGALMRRRSPD